MIKTIFLMGAMAVVAVIGVVIPNAASADGGMMVVTIDTPAAVTVTPQLTIAQKITALKTLVSLYSQVQAIESGIPEATETDEGKLIVVVNEAMRAQCRDVGTVGDWCVRHQGKLGTSYVNLSELSNFVYDKQFSYDLQLLRTRAETYGEADMPQYVYTLLRIVDLDFIQ